MRPSHGVRFEDTRRVSPPIMSSSRGPNLIEDQRPCAVSIMFSPRGSNLIEDHLQQRETGSDSEQPSSPNGTSSSNGTSSDSEQPSSPIGTPSGTREFSNGTSSDSERVESGENGRDDDGNSSLSVTGVSMRGASDSHELKC